MFPDAPRRSFGLRLSNERCSGVVHVAEGSPLLGTDRLQTMTDLEMQLGTPFAKGPDAPRPLSQPVKVSDRIFRSITTSAALASFVVMALIAFFLMKESWPAVSKVGFKFLTTFEWAPDEGTLYGVGSMLFGTAMIALIALVLAVPISVGTALYINEYAPRKLRGLFVSVIDLLAAVPSLIFGLWGLVFLQPRLQGLAQWLNDHAGGVPIFKATLRGIYGSSLFVSGIILAVMIIPIITSVSRSVMGETPRVHCEAALALGGTRAGMIRAVILPFGKSGLVGASMLGLGRALGETIAVALVLSNDFRIPLSFISPGGASVAGTIALKFPEASVNGRSALLGAGLILFALTLLVNLIARGVVNRSKRSKPKELAKSDLKAPKGAELL
jgi:phosphate transport system permease protein